jgi:hypothetical protein
MVGRLRNTVSDWAKDIIRKCLTVDASRRITIEEFRQHRWIKGVQAQPAVLNSPAILRDAQRVVSLRDIYRVGINFLRTADPVADEAAPRFAPRGSMRLDEVSSSSLLERYAGGLVPTHTHAHARTRTHTHAHARTRTRTHAHAHPRTPTLFFRWAQDAGDYLYACMRVGVCVGVCVSMSVRLHYLALCVRVRLSVRGGAGVHRRRRERGKRKAEEGDGQPLPPAAAAAAAAVTAPAAATLQATGDRAQLLPARDDDAMEYEDVQGSAASAPNGQPLKK